MSARLLSADDAVLIDAARAGDRSALEALLVRYQPRVFRFGMKMCRDPEDASDVLQETLLAAARTMRGFRGRSSLSTWLFAIARSFCIKQRRRARRAPGAAESLDAVLERGEDPAASRELDPERALLRNEIETTLDTAIRALAPAQREVLLLRDVEGLTAVEVAEVLGVSVMTVKSRLHRARLAVRERVAPVLGFAGAAAKRPGAGPRRPARQARRGTPPRCPDVVALLSRHLEGEITPEVCARMEAHVVTCPACRDACESLKRTLAACRSSSPPQLPGNVEEAVRSALRRCLAKIT